MATIEVTTVIAVPPLELWRQIEDIASHTEWMADAEEIRFTSPQHQGAGTTFDCETRVGPLRLTDTMAITAWTPGELMGVRHEGIVTGWGQFTLAQVSGGRTRFTWHEELAFPWWIGGPIGAVVGAAVLRRIWRANLERLKVMVEGQ